MLRTVTSLFFIQLFITFVVLFCIYFGFAIMDADSSMIELFEFMVFTPLLATVYSLATLGVCLIAGLPIRLNKRIKSWWVQHSSIPILGMVIGLLLLILSLYPPIMDTHIKNFAGQVVSSYVPNRISWVSGWCLLAFSMSHYYPQWVMRRIDGYIKNL